MSDGKQIPAVHQAILAAAVKAALGERAVIRQIVEVSAESVPLGTHVVALTHGIRTFWSQWTGRKANECSITDETSD
jgi:hypothetical protein